jgi:hypothetical protein
MKSIYLDRPFGRTNTAGKRFLKYFPLPSEKNLPRINLWAFCTALGIRAVIPGNFLNVS